MKAVLAVLLSIIHSGEGFFIYFLWAMVGILKRF